MSTRVDVEEIRTTKGEQLLAVVLALFLLIGGIWVYAKIDDAVRTSSPPDFSYRGTPAEQAAVRRLRQARLSPFTSRAGGRRSARQPRAPTRGVPHGARREPSRGPTRAGLQHGAGEARPGSARARLAREATSQRLARPPTPLSATSPESRPGARSGESCSRSSSALVFTIASLAFAYWLLAYLRRRRSRYYPVGMAVVAAAAILAFAGAADYLTDYFDPLDLGPLVLSLVRDRGDPDRLRRPPALPGEAPSGTARQASGVPVLRLPGPGERALRGLRPRRRSPRAPAATSRAESGRSTAAPAEPPRSR